MIKRIKNAKLTLQRMNGSSDRGDPYEVYTRKAKRNQKGEPSIAINSDLCGTSSRTSIWRRSRVGIAAYVQ